MRGENQEVATSEANDGELGNGSLYEKDMCTFMDQGQ